MEEQLTSIQLELNESKSQRNNLEKRFETAKSSSKATREEIAHLTVKMENLRQVNLSRQQEIDTLNYKLLDVAQSANTNSEVTNPEIQALGMLDAFLCAAMLE